MNRKTLPTNAQVGHNLQVPILCTDTLSKSKLEPVVSYLCRHSRVAIASLVRSILMFQALGMYVSFSKATMLACSTI